MAFNIKVLADEINNDPLGRGYSAMSDFDVAFDINAISRIRNRVSMSASEVFNAIDNTEFNALSADNQQLIWNIIHIGDLNPFGLEATIFTSVFGGGSTTISDLQNIRIDDISRAAELGLGEVREGFVTTARNE